MAGGPDSVTQTTATNPPDYLLPFLKDSATMAQRLMGRGPMNYFPGNTVVPFSPQTNQALNLQQNRALGGSPLVGSAQSFTQNLLGGNSPLNQNFSGGPLGLDILSGFTNGNVNPYLDATFDRAAGAVNRGLDTTLARAGRDLDANLGVRSDALNNLATNIYGGAYESDRNRGLNAATSMSNQIFSGGQNDLTRRLQAASTLGGQQLSALNNALPLAREDYFDIAQLGGVGSQVEQQAQNIIQDQMNRYNFAQEAPYASLDRFISQISGMPMGQQTSSTQPVFRNTAGGLLGGALTGGTLFGAGGPLAALGLGGPLGAGIGGLLSLLG